MAKVVEKRKKITPPKTDPVAAHAELIGRVTLAWTTVQYMIFLLFTAMSRLPVSAAEGIFFALRADSSQRDITLATANAMLAKDPDMLGRVKTALADIGKLAGQRNAAAHTIWAIQMPSGTFSPMPGLRQHGELKEDFPAQFKALEMALQKQVGRLGDLLAELAQRPASPDKGRQQTPPPAAS